MNRSRRNGGREWGLLFQKGYWSKEEELGKQLKDKIEFWRSERFVDTGKQPAIRIPGACREVTLGEKKRSMSFSVMRLKEQKLKRPFSDRNENKGISLDRLSCFSQ